MLLVSVVMLSYNHEAFVSESIESVLGQDFDDLELIIVDDASTDSSRQIIQKYAAEDRRIRVIPHEANCGIAKTANDGIAAAKGRFIAVIDSDDVWAKDKLTKQLDVVAYNDDLVVWSEGELIDDKGQLLGKNITEMYGATSRKKSGNIFQELLRGNYIFGTTLFFKRSNAGAIPFDEGLLYANDYKFMLELARNYDFYYIAEPLAKYRIHGSNTVGGKAVGSSRELKERQRICDRETASMYEEMLQQYNRTISNKAKAAMYAQMSCAHMLSGESKKTISFYLQALRCNPYSWSILASGVCVLKSILKNLGVRE